VAGARFEIVPLDRLREHEEIDVNDLEQLVVTLRTAGVVQEPLLVAEHTWVILNGHHRYRALRAMGANGAPAWVVDYEDERIALDRWTPGPTISKSEVVERARSGRLFPPKTTRHRLHFDLPAHPTGLADLGVDPVLARHAGDRDAL
jgi:hypothetical protein